jgi:hypothetical protein
MTLTQVATLLRGKSWQDLTAAQKLEVREAIAPAVRGFTSAQRAWLNRWWLQCTQSDVDAINATLPASVRVSPTTINGTLYLGADLLTDAQAGETFYKARAILARLVVAEVVYTPPAQGTP